MVSRPPRHSLDVLPGTRPGPFSRPAPSRRSVGPAPPLRLRTPSAADHLTGRRLDGIRRQSGRDDGVQHPARGRQVVHGHGRPSLNGFLHAAALVGTADVEVAKFAELAIGWFLPAVVGATAVAQAPRLDKGDYPGEQGTMEMNLNALEHITRTSEERNVSSDQPRLMQELAERAIAEGYGGQNYLAVFELLKRPTPSS
ncbi:hypothetical protein WEB32_01620 [Streptomyces netropsis]|uniref:imine reductase family protein n=1 Tax=Streptomyces netropsis TaxID=55404 RepID=UPI0030CCDA61